MRRHRDGSWNEFDPNRPSWTTATQLVGSYDYFKADAAYAYTIQKGVNPDGTKTFRTARRNPLPFGARNRHRRGRV